MESTRSRYSDDKPVPTAGVAIEETPVGLHKLKLLSHSSSRASSCSLVGLRILPVATIREASTNAIEERKRNIIMICRSSTSLQSLGGKKDCVKGMFEKPSVMPICGITTDRRNNN